MFLAIISPSSGCSSYSWNEWNVHLFFFHNQNNSTWSPGLLGNSALTCSRLHFWRHFLVKHKIPPNLVISNWLWWIMHVLLANQNWEIFWMNNNELSLWNGFLTCHTNPQKLIEQHCQNKKIDHISPEKFSQPSDPDPNMEQDWKWESWKLNSVF